MSEALIALRARYFFLSYSHSPPLTATPQTERDSWVRMFFSDLSSAVQRLGTRTLDIAPGYFDQDMPVTMDWRTSLTGALGSAEVFVPLYSPGYITRSLPGREWACFRQRMRDARIGRPLDRFEPVLWIPLQPGEATPDDLAKALELGASERGYAENGLQAMLRLAPYRRSYLRIVERLAGRIIELAERHTISPSPVADIDAVASPFIEKSATSGFAIAVAALVRSNAPAETAREAYGATSSAWRPFAHGQELTAYAAAAAEQLDFVVRVSDLDQPVQKVSDTPGIVLIDPLYAADNDRLAKLIRALTGRPWVLPVLVISPEAGRLAAELGERVRMVLRTIRPAQSDSARQAADGIGTLRDFFDLMPFLVAEAGRQFRRHGPIMRSPGKAGLRPRFSGKTSGNFTDEGDSDG